MSQSFICEKPKDFKHIIRVLNTNLEGKRNVVNSLTQIKGIGRRLAHLICQLAKVDVHKRAGEYSTETWDTIAKIIAEPGAHGVPSWCFNRRRDYRTNEDMHISSNMLDTKIREDLEVMKKMRRHRGLRHHWLLKVRGQHTNATGRRGVTIGVVRKGNKKE
jgi:small subunit ribosomal protein S18e